MREDNLRKSPKSTFYREKFDKLAAVASNRSIKLIVRKLPNL